MSCLQQAAVVERAIASEERWPRLVLALVVACAWRTRIPLAAVFVEAESVAATAWCFRTTGCLGLHCVYTSYSSCQRREQLLSISRQQGLCTGWIRAPNDPKGSDATGSAGCGHCSH